MGALLIGPIGALADARGIHVALLSLACVLAGGLACALALPARMGVARPAPELAEPAFAAE